MPHIIYLGKLRKKYWSSLICSAIQLSILESLLQKWPLNQKRNIYINSYNLSILQKIEKKYSQSVGLEPVTAIARQNVYSKKLRFRQLGRPYNQ